LSRVQVQRRTGVRPSYCGGAAFLDIVEIVYSYRTSIVEGTNHREQQIKVLKTRTGVMEY
jgi:hypothetical protein